eukprot:COSAG01_NODE_25_length_37050_cov_211.559119_1_plen_83_part_00
MAFESEDSSDEEEQAALTTFDPNKKRAGVALAHRHHMHCLAERLQPLPLGSQVRRDLQLAQKRVEVIVICTEKEEVARAAGP